MRKKYGIGMGPQCGRARSWAVRLRSVLAITAVGAMVCVTTTAPAQAQGIHDSLVVHLTFDGDVLDHSGNGNDGTIVRPGCNSPFVMGIITANRVSASAFESTGPCLGTHMESNNYITFGVPAPGSGLDFGTDTDFSFSYWGLIPGPMTAFHDPSWISNKDWDSGGNIGYVLATQGPPYTAKTGGFKWNYTTDTTPRTDSFRCDSCGLDDAQWHHYVVTFTRYGDGVMYIDGLEVDRKTLNFTGSLDAGLPVNVMQDGTGNYTDGDACANWNDASICDLGIWQRALTADDVATIYAQGLCGVSALD